MVQVQVWDLSGQYRWGFQKVSVEVLARAEELARARAAVEVEGLVRVALRDLDLAQAEAEDLEWALEQELDWLVEGPLTDL